MCGDLIGCLGLFQSLEIMDVSAVDCFVFGYVVNFGEGNLRC